MRGVGKLARETDELVPDVGGNGVVSHPMTTSRDVSHRFSFCPGFFLQFSFQLPCLLLCALGFAHNAWPVFVGSWCLIQKYLFSLSSLFLYFSFSLSLLFSLFFFSFSSFSSISSFSYSCTSLSLF